MRNRCKSWNVFSNWNLPMHIFLNNERNWLTIKTQQLTLEWPRIDEASEGQYGGATVVAAVAFECAEDIRIATMESTIEMPS